MLNQALGLAGSIGVSGGVVQMNDSEIRRRVVKRMWTDDILENVRYADVETIADFAVPSSAEGRAKELLTEEMVDNDECPVVWGIAGQAVTLRNDREAVARYILVHGGEDALPWPLKGVVDEEEVTKEVTEQTQ